MIREARAQVPPSLDGERLDRALAALAGTSRGLARRVIALGGAWLDGRRVRTLSRPVRTGQMLSAWWADPPEPDPAPLAPSAVLARAGGWIAADKPAGVHAQSARHRVAGTLPDLLAGLLGLATAPEPVHRLDVETSGVMLLATDGATASRLSERFREGGVHRAYLAVSVGGPEADAGVVEAPIGPDPARPGRMRVPPGPDPEARPASTAWTVLARGGDLALLRVEPRTGRTHQIRVHAAHAGWPLLGDARYAPPEVARRAGILCLHAWRLDLPAGLPGAPRRLEAAVPPALAAVLAAAGLPPP